MNINIYKKENFKLFEREILDFYKNSMSIFAMFEPVRKRVFRYCIMQLCLVVVFIILFMTFKELLTFIDIFLSFFLLELWITSFVFVYMYFKSYILREYKVKFESKEWYNFKYLLLKKFLLSKNILNRPNKNKSKNIQTLDFCLERFEKYHEKKNKKKFLTIIKSSSAVFIAFSAAIWTAFNNWVFQKHEIHIEQATAYLAAGFVFLFFIFVVVVIIRYYFILFSFGEQRIIELIEILQGIKFSLNNIYYLDQFESEAMHKLIVKIIDEYELKSQNKK